MPVRTLTTPPDFAVPCETTPRVDVVQFGDGYAQRSVRGINVCRDTWKLTFTSRDKAVVDDIVLTLKSGLGGYFLWTPPGESTPSKWTTAKPWQRTPTEYGWSLGCELEQVF